MNKVSGTVRGGQSTKSLVTVFFAGLRVCVMRCIFANE